MVGTSRDRDVSQYKQNHGLNLELHSRNRKRTGIYHSSKQNHGWNFKRDRNVSRNRDIYKQNHGWNFKRQGYITVETESWLELQETGYITVETESWLELQETGIYHSRNRMMVGTSRDRNVSQYKQNHGWNFKRQGYITVETESWLELQET